MSESERKPPEEAQRKQAAPVGAQLKRSDPEPRWADGAMMNTVLRGKDPNRKYVFVYNACNQFGIGHFLELGYVIEKYRDDGPRLFGGMTGKMGEEITFRGHTLMSIDKERYQKLYMEGHPLHGSGQRRWDTIRANISKKSQNHLIGRVPGAEYMHVKNESAFE